MLLRRYYDDSYKTSNITKLSDINKAEQQEETEAKKPKKSRKKSEGAN